MPKYVVKFSISGEYVTFANHEIHALNRAKKHFAMPDKPLFTASSGDRLTTYRINEVEWGEVLSEKTTYERMEEMLDDYKVTSYDKNSILKFVPRD